VEGRYAQIPMLSAAWDCCARRQCGVLKPRLLRHQYQDGSCQKIFLSKVDRIYLPESHYLHKAGQEVSSVPEHFWVLPDTGIVTHCLQPVVVISSWEMVCSLSVHIWQFTGNWDDEVSCLSTSEALSEADKGSCWQFFAPVLYLELLECCKMPGSS
jgi:hypothetical protein